MHTHPIVRFFAPDPLVAVVPWGYAWRTYVAWPRRTVGHTPRRADAVLP